MPHAPDGFRHSIPLEIRFGDLDALGHVNNAKYLTYMEQARVHYFRDAALWDARPTEIGLIMAKATVEFKLPLLLDDKIRIYTRVSRLGNKSFDAEHQIIREDGALAALGFITIVVFNYPAHESLPIPDMWRQKLIAFEPGLHE